MLDARDGVKKAIRKSGLKQEAVARRVNLSPRQLSDIVSKRKKLDADMLFKICEVVGTTPNDIFEIQCSSKSDMRQFTRSDAY